jgi:multiple sugar transport system permease protein
MRLSLHAREALSAYGFLLPFLAMIGIFFGYAFVRTLYFSLHAYDLSIRPPAWVGIANYLAIIERPLFLLALRNTIAFAAVVTTMQTLAALLLALALNNRVVGVGAFRTAYYLPSVTSSIVITLIFIWLYQRRGAVNFLLTEILRLAPIIVAFLLVLVAVQLAQALFEHSQGLPAAWTDPALMVTSALVALAVTIGLSLTGVIRPAEASAVDIPWLTTTATFPAGGPAVSRVPIPLWAIMSLNIWTTAPTFMIMFLAALQNVPRSLYEAAAIDGAGTFQQHLYVTIPSIRPVLFLVIALGLIGTLQVFDQVAITAGIAPLEGVVTLAYFVYTSAFPTGATPQIGIASAAAMILALLTGLFVLIQRRFLASEAQ